MEELYTYLIYGIVAYVAFKALKWSIGSFLKIAILMSLGFAALTFI